MSSFRRLIGLSSILLVLSACGGGGSGGGDSGAQPPPPSTPTYTVATSVTGSGSGSLSPTSRSVSQGSSTTFTISPASGSTLAGVSGCGGSLSGSTYTTDAISSSCTVTATFDLIAYTVTASAGSGGSISPGSVSVSHGVTTSFTVTPSSGYQISAVSGCGGSLSGNTYTTGPVTSACSVAAIFTQTSTPPPPPPATYTIGGTVSGLTGTLNLQNNDAETLTISQNGSFTFESRIADGSSYLVSVRSSPSGQNCAVANGSGVVVGSSVSNVLVTCSASAVTYMATGELAAPSDDGSGPYGAIEPSSQQVSEGGYAEFLATPSPGYRFHSAGFGSCGDWIQESQPSGAVLFRVGPLFSDCSFSVAFNLDSTPRFSVGGSASGLNGTLVLQNNGTDDISLDSDGVFSFPTRVGDGASYLVTVRAQPHGQTCSVSNASGTVSGSNVTNVIVDCMSDVGRYTVGGVVSGLNGSVTLANNSSDEFVVNTDGAFSFPTLFQDGDSYSVTVTAQPSGQVCSVTNASGVVNANNVTNVLVSCEATSPSYTVTAVIINGAGSALPPTQQVQPGDVAVVTVVPVDPFSIPSIVGCDGSLIGNTYTTAPVQQSCQLEINFDPPRAANLRAYAGSKAVELTWDDTGAVRYNLIYSATPGCDSNNYRQCDGGTLVMDVQSPFTVSGLENDRSYWFYVESEFGYMTTSSEVGASPNIFAVGGAVNDIAVQTTGSESDIGSVAIGGEFTSVGILTGAGVPLDPVDGQPSGAFPRVQGQVNVAISDNFGGWYIGGEFSQVGGLARTNLAHIQADGTLSDWQPRTNAAVHSLSLALPDNVLYIAGDFTSVNDVSRVYLAAISRSGALLPWSPTVDGGVNGLVEHQGTIYIGGEFSIVDGLWRRGLAAINPDGTVTPWWYNTMPRVTLIAANEGTIYYAFETNEGHALSALTADGTAALGTIFAYGGAIKAIAFDDDFAYLGGDFVNIRSGNRTVQANGLIQVSRSLGYFSDDPWTLSTGGGVSSLSVLDDTLYVGGTFPDVGGMIRQGLAALSLTTLELTDWSPSTSGAVHAITANSDRLYVGGDFNSIGLPATCVAIANPEGVLRRDINLSAGRNYRAPCRINAVEFVGDDLYVGGNNLAIIGPEGLASLYAFVDVYDIAVATDAVIIAGDLGSRVCPGILALSTSAGRPILNGIPECAWSGGGPSPDGPVYSVDVRDGTIYFGGEFSSLSRYGVSRSNLGAIMEDGTLLAWNPGLNGRVHAVEAAADGIYVGGSFGSVGGLSRANLASISTNGAVNAWAPIVLGSVYTLQVTENSVYVGGGFSAVNGSDRNNVASLSKIGSLGSLNLDVGGIVRALAVTDEDIRMGGDFPLVLEIQP